VQIIRFIYFGTYVYYFIHVWGDNFHISCLWLSNRAIGNGGQLVPHGVDMLMQ
jgi:hypothetical protein